MFFTIYTISGIGLIGYGAISHLLSLRKREATSFNVIRSPLMVLLAVLLSYYAFIIYVIPVYYSYDAVAYYLPYARGILAYGGIPHDYKELCLFMGEPSFGGAPPGMILLYTYAMYLFPAATAFKLLPLLFLLIVVSATYKIGEVIFEDREVALASVSLAVSVPALYVFVGSTPYNLDMGLAAYYLTTVYLALRYILAGGRSWALFLGLSLSLTMLSVRYGYAYVVPILILLSLTMRRPIRNLLPAALVAAIGLFEAWRGAGLAVGINMWVLAILIFLVSRCHEDMGQAEVSKDLKHLLAGLVGTSWYIINVFRFGSPFFPPLFLLLSPEFGNSLQWAVKMRNAIYGAQSVKYRPFYEVMTGIPRLFIAPLTGCLLLTCGWLGIANLILRRGKGEWKDRYILILYLFLIELVMWMWETQGDLYKNRHMLHITCVISILSAYGLVSTLRKAGVEHVDGPTFVLSSALFSHMQWNYISFDVRRFIVWRSEMFLIPGLPAGMPTLQVLVGAIVIPLIATHQMLKRPHIRRAAVIVSLALLLAVVATPVFATLQAISEDFDGDIAAYRWAIGAGRSYEADVIQYFRAVRPEGIVVAFRTFALEYYADIPVVRLDEDDGLILLKNVLVSEDEEWIYHELKKMGIKYVLVPNAKNMFYEAFLRLKDCTLVKMLHDERYFKLKKSFTYYELYELA